MGLVTLIDGREVDSASEDWRAECEARAVCNMPNKAARHEYVERVRKRRGCQPALKLQEDVRRVWAADKAKSISDERSG